ncbi:hypothetical protein YC2023_118842 [Brassica napus]
MLGSNHTSRISREPIADFKSHIGEFTYPRLADFGAAICGANRHQAQEVHEELDETIANAIEEKISGEQRRYLLIEQHKAIKKELGVETDDKSALSGEFTYPQLADFGAAICGANRHQAQEVLEKLDETIAKAIEEKISGEQRRYLLNEQLKAIKKVHKRLQLTLELMKKEREISKIQETIAKAIEEKISGEQRRYLLNEQLKAIKKHIGEFTYPRLADFGAAICGANRHQAQEVLEELDVHKHLRLTLELMKKEREISKIRETIAKAIEEKISGEQRRYLLNEQLKAIKKELGVETDDKSALSGEY